ncbi:hypothetical protein [Desulfovibrio sp. ZJ369]|uniref:hypothetical protein n=1 Tax=Desulfovibrio sp. ZJ369 TaxID=2709793 RepID=UPI0013ED05C9|nr:hypothetical protein [Desulfovibrio sp. ZJ369]
MHEETERGIKFSFPDAWHILRYENSNFYKNKMMPLQHTRAADFLCCNGGKTMILEVKRYTEKPFKGAGENLSNFIDEVGWQFRDTICGISIAKISNNQGLKPYYSAVFSEKSDASVKLTLFIELENIASGIKKSIMSDILQKLKQRFGSMGFAVRVVDSQSLRDCSWKAEVLPCN